MAEMKRKGLGVTDLADNELGKVWNDSFVEIGTCTFSLVRWSACWSSLFLWFAGEVSLTEQPSPGQVHLRYLAGGRAPPGALRNEKLYRFQFPESPGALDR